MTDTLKHRGPDGEGFYLNTLQDSLPVEPSIVYQTKGKGNVVLGHRRLSIIDLAGGHQPLSNEDRTVWVTYNGEIYNFNQVRDELIKKGHHFKTNCDTEIIVHGYEEWGEDCVRKFRGMFAFIVWDAKNETMFAARDRLGIKPFYYYSDNERFVFGSEIKAILAVEGVKKDLNQQAIFDYLNLLYIPAPKSIFQNIKKLLPGHTLTIKKGQMCESKKYWDLSFVSVNQSLSESEWCERVIDKLEEAVKIRLVSDVSLGAFLSGGIDSSAVVALMSGLMGKPVKTSSIGFKEEKFNELPYAQKIVSKYQTDHQQEIIEADAVDILEKLVWYYDEPFADSSAIPTYLVSKITKQRVTVALSGDGGDENFAGYRRYYFDLMENKLRDKFSDSFRKTFVGKLAVVYPKADWLPQIFRAKTLLSNLAMSPMEGYFNSMSWFGPYKDKIISSDLRDSLDDYSPVNLFNQYGKVCDSSDPLSKIQYVDIKTYLVDDILVKVDRASMANSLEVRVPLLDHEFMELVATMPSSLKLHGKEGKYLLKKSLEPLLPKDILYRPKMGFSVPLAKWMREDLRRIFEDNVMSSNNTIGSYLHMPTVKEMWQKHQAGFSDYASELWAILFFAMWAKRYV